MPKPIVRHLVAAVLGAVLCFVPLFDLVGYESAAACGSVLGVVAIFATVHDVRRGLPLVAAEFGRLLLRNQALQIAPLALLSLNALRVQNCDPWAGFQFWLAIVPGAILVGQALAWSCLAFVGPRRLAAVLALLLV